MSVSVCVFVGVVVSMLALAVLLPHAVFFSVISFFNLSSNSTCKVSVVKSAGKFMSKVHPPNTKIREFDIFMDAPVRRSSLNLGS